MYCLGTQRALPGWCGRAVVVLSAVAVAVADRPLSCCWLGGAHLTPAAHLPRFPALQVVPGVAIAFMTYELAKKTFGVTTNATQR